MDDDILVLRCVSGVSSDKFLRIFETFSGSYPLDAVAALFSEHVKARIHSHPPPKPILKSVERFAGS